MGISSLFSDPQGFLLELLYRIPAVLVALSFHEWGHAYAAYRLGDPTARNLGRMTVNPVAHIDPYGLLCMVLFRVGWAKPVPINPRNFHRFRRDDAIVSVAGITMNFLLALVGFVGVYTFMLLNGENAIVANMLYYFVFINLCLMVFNLLPVPPLDGSHLLESLLIKITGPKPWIFLQRYGSIILIVLLLTGVINTVLDFVIGPIFSGLVSLFDNVFGVPGMTYLYHVMMGW